jgi:hypothetical protein
MIFMESPSKISPFHGKQLRKHPRNELFAAKELLTVACVFSSALLEDWDEELGRFSRWIWEGVRKTDEGRIYASIFGGIGSEILVIGEDWWVFELNLETSGFLFQCEPCLNPPNILSPLI